MPAFGQKIIATPFLAVSPMQFGRTITRRDPDQFREELVSLAVACPRTKSNPSRCPLHEVRKLEPTAIMDWLDGMSSDDQDFLRLYHQCCLVTQWDSESVEGRGDSKLRETDVAGEWRQRPRPR